MNHSSAQSLDPVLIDTHCHLHDRSAYDFALSRNRKCSSADYTPEKLIQNAHGQGIAQMICIGTTHQDSLAARDFAAAHPNQGLFWSYGIHPEEANSAKGLIGGGGDGAHLPFVGVRSAAARGATPATRGDGLAGRVDERQMHATSSPTAIGEVGLDYHTTGYDRPAQIHLLEEMLDLARRHDLPLIFHVRDAFDDFWPIIDNAHVQRAVVHSFSDAAANLEQALDRGFYIGINGLATFARLYAVPSSASATTLANAAPLPPLDRILLETDAPFLAPTPHRGLPNQPAYIRDIAVWLAATLQSAAALPEDLAPDQALAAVAAATTQNARTLFSTLDQNVV